jgi:hypothetical protein
MIENYHFGGENVKIIGCGTQFAMAGTDSDRLFVWGWDESGLFGMQGERWSGVRGEVRWGEMWWEVKWGERRGEKWEVRWGEVSKTRVLFDLIFA